MTRSEWCVRFSRNLRRLIDERDLTVSEVAERVGVRQGSISRYLSENIFVSRGPSGLVLLNLSYVLGVSVDELIDFGEPVEGRYIDETMSERADSVFKLESERIYNLTREIIEHG